MCASTCHNPRNQINTRLYYSSLELERLTAQISSLEALRTLTSRMHTDRQTPQARAEQRYLLQESWWINKAMIDTLIEGYELRAMLERSEKQTETLGMRATAKGDRDSLADTVLFALRDLRALTARRESEEGFGERDYVDEEYEVVRGWVLDMVTNERLMTEILGMLGEGRRGGSEDNGNDNEDGGVEVERQ